MKYLFVLSVFFSCGTTDSNGDTISDNVQAILPMADFLEDSKIADVNAIGNSDANNDFDRFESPLMQQLSEADMARDSESIIKEDEIGGASGGSSFARQEIFEELNAIKNYIELSENEGNIAIGRVNEEEEIAIGGSLEIYNVDDFDDRNDDALY